MKRELAFAVLLTLVLTNTAAAMDSVALMKRTPYTEGNDIPDKIKNERNIDSVA